MKRLRVLAHRFILASAAITLAGCAGPAPIVVYEDKLDSIWITFDPEAASGHSHPAAIPPEIIAKVLRGIHIQSRDVISGFDLFADDETVPAFSGADVVLLAPRLSKALTKASPKDLVTFYLTRGQPRTGRLITSGGLFLRDQRLYVMLANAGTSPSSGQYETPYEIDVRSDPLLPLARFKFKVLFMPREAWITWAEARKLDSYERYLDEAKLIVVDMQRLAGATDSPTTGPSTLPSPQ